MDVVPGEQTGSQEALETAHNRLAFSFWPGAYWHHGPDTEGNTRSPAVRRNRALAGQWRAGSVANAAFQRAGFSDPTLVLRWQEIAGPEVARLARPLKFSDGPSGGTLTLRAAPGAALFLAHEKRALCDRINAYLGRPAVGAVEIQPGRVPAAAT